MDDEQTAGPPTSPPPDDGSGAAASTGDGPATQRLGLARRLGDRVGGRLAIYIAAGVGGGLLLAQLVAAVVGRLQWLITILVISFFLSFAMEPAVQFFARRGVRRGLGTAIVFVIALLIFAGFLAAMAPLIAAQVRNLVAAGPTLLEDLARQAVDVLPAEMGDAVADWLIEQRRALPDTLPGMAGQLGRGALGIGQTLLGAVFQLLTVSLVTFYLVADGPRWRRALASRLEPRAQIRVLGLWELAIAKMGGYVYSRALTAVVSAAFHSLAFTLLGVDYPLALGVWVGLLSSLIPAIGTYIAGVLPLLVAFAASPFIALWVLIVITVYQQVENYLIVPKITAVTVELHPVVAFLSVLAGAAVAGATGALLAIPAVAIVTALISAAAEEYEVLEHELFEVTPKDLRADLRLQEQADDPSPS